MMELKQHVPNLQNTLHMYYIAKTFVFRALPSVHKTLMLSVAQQSFEGRQVNILYVFHELALFFADQGTSYVFGCSLLLVFLP